MPTVTNRTACSALRGENVVVSLDRSDTDNVLPTLTVGQTCTITGDIGLISEIFSGGNKFKIKPNTMSKTFDSSTAPGVLIVGEVITIT